jgi:uncharacterized protein with HEPN domain
METKIRTWLYDVSNAIDEIHSFFADSPENLEEFRHDIRTKRAVERNIEIIGEALNRILTIQPDIPISDARKIVDTRNRIIHAYDNVSDEIMWSIIIKHLPILKTEIRKLLTLSA